MHFYHPFEKLIDNLWYITCYQFISENAKQQQKLRNIFHLQLPIASSKANNTFLPCFCRVVVKFPIHLNPVKVSWKKLGSFVTLCL